VYAGIIIIGLIGLATDQILAWFGPRLFPWTAEASRAKRLGLKSKMSALNGSLRFLRDSRLQPPTIAAPDAPSQQDATIEERPAAANATLA
jgi:hypothetical protein